MFTGCMTTNPTTGEKELDPVMTDLVLSSAEDGLAQLVYWTGKADENTASAWVIARSVLDGLVTDVDIDRTEIQRRLMEIEIDGMSEADRQYLILSVSNIVLNKYDILRAYLLRQSIDSSEVASMTINTLRNGVQTGLMILGK